MAGCENQQRLCPGETEGRSRIRHPLKGPEHKHTCLQKLVQNSNKVSAACKAPGTYGEELNCLTLG